MTPKALDAKLDAIDAGLVEVARQIAADRELSAKRIKRHDRSIALAIGFGVIGLAVGMVGVVVGSDARDAVDLVNEQRAEARVASCHKDNDTVEKINGILQTIAAATTRPEAQEFFASLLLPRRDCSTEGIEAYLSTSTSVP